MRRLHERDRLLAVPSRTPRTALRLRNGELPRSGERSVRELPSRLHEVHKPNCLHCVLDPEEKRLADLQLQRRLLRPEPNRRMSL